MQFSCNLDGSGRNGRRRSEADELFLAHNFSFTRRSIFVFVCVCFFCSRCLFWGVGPKHGSSSAGVSVGALLPLSLRHFFLLSGRDRGKIVAVTRPRTKTKKRDRKGIRKIVSCQEERGGGGKVGRAGRHYVAVKIQPVTLSSAGLGGNHAFSSPAGGLKQGARRGMEGEGEIVLRQLSVFRFRLVCLGCTSAPVALPTAAAIAVA